MAADLGEDVFADRRIVIRWLRSRAMNAQHRPHQVGATDDASHPAASNDRQPLDVVAFHQADDIGHNLSWEAPVQLAADIVSFVRTGAPTTDGTHGTPRTDSETRMYNVSCNVGVRY